MLDELECLWDLTLPLMFTEGTMMQSTSIGSQPSMIMTWVWFTIIDNDPPKMTWALWHNLIDTYWSNVDEVIGFLFSIDPMFCYNLNLPSGRLRHSPVRNKANRYFQSTVVKSAKSLRSAVDLHKLGCNAQIRTICCHACCQDFRATFYLGAGRLVVNNASELLSLKLDSGFHQHRNPYTTKVILVNRQNGKHEVIDARWGWVRS